MINELDYPGAVGPDLTAKWFTDRAMELGVRFLDPIPQQIHSLSDKPRYPGASGYARTVKTEDAPLFVEWMLAYTATGEFHSVDDDELKKRSYQNTQSGY